MMRNTLYIIAAVLLLSACSQTHNMPEGETLYKGIKEISYGARAKSAVEWENSSKTVNAPQKGVITSIANAAYKIDSLLTGKRSVNEVVEDLKLKQRDKSFTPAQQDSIRTELTLVESAWNEAKTELEAALACPPNGSLMGSSSISQPFTFGLFAHNYFIDSKTWFGKWIYNTFGTSPKYISTVNPRTRVRVARNILRNNGFFNSDVTYDVIPLKDSLKAKIAYSVFPGNLYRLDSIEFRPFPVSVDTIIRRNLSATKLISGNGFNVSALDEEKTRLSDILRDRGFYNFRPEFITYKADTVMRPGHVQLRVEPVSPMPEEATRRYVIGDTRITMLKYDDFVIVDSISPRRSKRRTGDSVTSSQLAASSRSSVSGSSRRLSRLRDVKMLYSGCPGKEPLRLSEIRKYLYYQKGNEYNHSRMSRVGDRLSGMGLFSQMQMDFSPRRAQDSLAPDTLDVNIFAMLDKPFDSEFTANVVNKTNGLLGPSLSYSISKKNAFRRAETLKFKVYGSYEWQTGAGSSGTTGAAMNSFEVGGQLSLSYPRLLMPGGRRLSNMAKAATDFAVDVSWMRRAGYYSMAQFKAAITYSYQRRSTISHTFTPLSLKFTSLLSRTDEFDRILEHNPVLAVSMRDQLVPAMSYTLNMTTRRTARRPRTFSLTVKEAGNIVNGIYSLCGKGWDTKNKELLNVPFAQFLKFTADFKQELPLNASSSLVAHVSTGYVHSLGNSLTAPYSDLFAVGGANSIRAFCLRGIGPGSYNPQSGGYSYINQNGNFKFELNLEYRFRIVGNLNGALFVDAGNVWVLEGDESRPGSGFSFKDLGRELALGTGAGIRYDLSFLVLRFDIGVGIHAPYDTGKSGYYNMRKFWDSLGFHLAVGYPF